MNRRLQRDALTDTVVDLLEIKWALLRLRKEHPEHWRLIQHVDIERPFAPPAETAIPVQARRGNRMLEQARRLGVSVRAIDEQCRTGWKYVLTYILDDIHEQVRAVVEDMESRDADTPRLL